MPHPFLALYAGALLMTPNAIIPPGPHGTEFLDEAIKSDNAEIRLGALAAQKGGSAGVRHFGEMLVTDHNQDRAKAASLDRQMETSPPADVKPEDKQEEAKLKGLSGSAFDHEFLKHMVDAHRHSIAIFQGEVRAPDPQALHVYASQSLPVLQKHLQLAQQLQQSGQ